MKYKALFMILLLLLLSSCGSQSTENVEEKEQVVEEEPVEEPVWVNDETEESTIAEQAEQFAERMVYLMNTEDCISLYIYISDDYKQDFDEQEFLMTCRYWVYEWAYKITKFVQIDETTFLVYIEEPYDLYSQNYFDTMTIHYNNGVFTYDDFETLKDFTDIKAYCTDNLVWDDSERCIERFARANQDETICIYLGSETKVEYCKEKVRRLLE